jgi:hypothetical protein
MAAIFFVKAAETVNTQEVLLFDRVETLSLVTLIRGLGVSEGDKGEFVLGVKIAAER